VTNGSGQVKEGNKTDVKCGREKKKKTHNRTTLWGRNIPSANQIREATPTTQNHPTPPTKGNDTQVDS